MNNRGYIIIVVAIVAASLLLGAAAETAVAQDRPKGKQRSTLEEVWLSAEIGWLSGDTDFALARYEEYLLLCAQAESFGEEQAPKARTPGSAEKAARRAMAIRQQWRARLRSGEIVSPTVRAGTGRAGEPPRLEPVLPGGPIVVKNKQQAAEASRTPVDGIALANVPLPVRSETAPQPKPDERVSTAAFERAIVRLADAAAMSAEGRSREALRIYEEIMPAIRTHPAVWAVALEDRVNCLAKLGRLDEARKLCRDAMRDLPEIAGAVKVLLADLNAKAGEE